MVDWPTPLTIKDLRGFLGITGCHRRFIRHYGLISKPLTELLKKGSFYWNEAANQAFMALKKAMITTPVLSLPDYSIPFVLETDACSSGVEVVLMQSGKPLAYYSKSLAPKHQGLSTYEKELLAIVMLTHKWRALWTRSYTKRISQFFYWPQMKQKVIAYVQACDICQRIKSSHTFPGGLLQPLPIPTQIWEDVSMDFVEGFPKSDGKDSILVVVDRFTKIGHFIALSHPYSATDIAQTFLDNIYKLHGLPRTIVSHRDKIFTSQFWKALFDSVGTKTHLSTSYHPQTNGRTNRLNRSLEQYVRAMTSSRPKNWTKWLSLAEWWYNSTHNSAIKMSPFEVVYGTPPRQLCFPIAQRSTVDCVLDFQIKREAMNNILKDAITTAQNRYKQFADSKKTDVSYQNGDYVYLKLQPYKQLSVVVRRYLKLSHKYFGPYLILDKIGQVAYKLQLPVDSLIHLVFHVSLLKKKVGSDYKVTIELPKLGLEGQFLVCPVKVLQRRMVKKGNVAITQWLIQ
ncbi:hypothetical protein AgCh_007165 [Apium graveolens]